MQGSGVKTGLGDPVTAGGETVVPPARIVYGVGGGYAGTSAGFIRITPGSARWVPPGDGRRIAAALAPGIAIGLVLGRCRPGA